MYLIDQHTKAIMEECKLRARDAGLKFQDESLEYIVTNRDLLELSPKAMIPTLYDYWVNDVEILKGKGIYKLYPSNPYETVINSKPAISFYNDNNPDWLNIMIFYHVLGHIDFFQNNILFEYTWKDDFVGQALADKRLMESLRSEHGRWVDYIIEFSRSIDNLVGYFKMLSVQNFPKTMNASDRVNFYFGQFLQEICKVPEHELFKDIERFNQIINEQGALGESSFFSEVRMKYPEFQAKFDKFIEKGTENQLDVLEYIRDNSPYLMKEDNLWMKSVITIIRNTSLYFSPQIRTKIINEGWASYWHDELFRRDDRIKGHEVSYAVVNAGVTSISRVGLNPYAIGLRLIQHIEQLAEKGKINYNYDLEHDSERRLVWGTSDTGPNKSTGKGKEAIFDLRTKFSDFTLINTYVSQEFVDDNNLFVVGQRMDEESGMIQYYIKSKKAEDYKQMLMESLYHPPKVMVDIQKTNEDRIYLKHYFEGKPLFKDYIADVLIGIEYLWGGQVDFETVEAFKVQAFREGADSQIEERPVLYTCKDRKVSKKNL